MCEITVNVDELFSIVNDVKEDNAEYVTITIIAPNFERNIPTTLEFSVVSTTDSCIEMLIKQAVAQICSTSETINSVSQKMKQLASLLPEYPVVIEFYGVGDVLCPQLMAEIGDIYRFARKESLVCFAGLEVPPNQSGKYESNRMGISKKGSPHLRKTLFQVMDCLIKQSPTDDPVYQFLDRKRSEGKHYRNYMTAGSAKFLRIYYARTKEFLDNLYSE